MRLRTGHGPADWTENAPGASPHRHSGIVYGGSLIVGESEADRRRRWEKDARARRVRPEVVTYGTGANRWTKAPRCGAVNRYGPCARMIDHRGSCSTAEAMEKERIRRRKAAAA